MNRNYLRSRSRENTLKKKLEAEGWYVIRAAGSKGVADLIAIKPREGVGNPNLYDVRFIQIKVSVNCREQKQEFKVESLGAFLANIEWLTYPVKTKKWYENRRQRKVKASIRTNKKVRSVQAKR